MNNEDNNTTMETEIAEIGTSNQEMETEEGEISTSNSESGPNIETSYSGELPNRPRSPNFNIYDRIPDLLKLLSSNSSPRNIEDLNLNLHQRNSNPQIPQENLRSTLNEENNSFSNNDFNTSELSEESSNSSPGNIEDLNLNLHQSHSNLQIPQENVRSTLNEENNSISNIDLNPSELSNESSNSSPRNIEDLNLNLHQRHSNPQIPQENVRSTLNEENNSISNNDFNTSELSNESSNSSPGNIEDLNLNLHQSHSNLQIPQENVRSTLNEENNSISNIDLNTSEPSKEKYVSGFSHPNVTQMHIDAVCNTADQYVKNFGTPGLLSTSVWTKIIKEIPIIYPHIKFFVTPLKILEKKKQWAVFVASKEEGKEAVALSFVKEAKQMLKFFDYILPTTTMKCDFIDPKEENFYAQLAIEEVVPEVTPRE